MQNAEFNHPRLAQVYDAQCGWSAPDAFFVEWANEHPTSDILDLGCGTGRITLELARAGHRVTGIDLALASLERARAKAGAQAVTWLHGTAAQAPEGAFDTALMTSHVAQFILTDEEWNQTLQHLHAALRPGGRLIFDTRDPAARVWETWNPPESGDEATLPDGVKVNIWTEVNDVSGEIVTFTHHYTFSDGSAELRSRNTLRFRPEKLLRESLSAAGFQIQQIYGGWQREDVGRGDGEFIVVARKGQ